MTAPPLLLHLLDIKWVLCPLARADFAFGRHLNVLRDICHRPIMLKFYILLGLKHHGKISGLNLETLFEIFYFGRSAVGSKF